MLGGGDVETFMGVPRCSVDALTGIDIVIIGAPCATPYASVGPYCKDAPSAIRAASGTFSATRHHHNFDLDGPIVPDGTTIADLGDLEWSANDSVGNRQRIEAACAAVRAAGAVPVVIGGDDSIPIPVISAYSGSLDLSVLQVDAHIDWRDEVRGERLGLSSTMRRTSEMKHVGKIVQVGRRGVGSARTTDVEDASTYGVVFFGAHAIHRAGVGDAVRAIPPGGDVFITIDVDGLDPTTMPGVVGREPGGLTYWHAIELIDGAAERARIVGFSIVEFVPELDSNGVGALTAFRLTAHAIGRIARQRG